MAHGALKLFARALPSWDLPCWGPPAFFAAALSLESCFCIPRAIAASVVAFRDRSEDPPGIGRGGAPASVASEMTFRDKLFVATCHACETAEKSAFVGEFSRHTLAGARWL